ncbi:hypothetical protein ACJMK2_044098, partial [Sinanodonta woodiana]
MLEEINASDINKIPKTGTVNSSIPKYHILWWNDDCKNTIKQKKALTKLCNTGYSTDYMKYKTNQKQTKHVIRSANATTGKTSCSTLEIRQ